MSNAQQQQDKLTRGDALGILYLIAGSHAVCITPFIRKDVGAEYFGVRAVGAVLFMGLLSEGRWLTPMGLYLIAWFVALIYRRIETFRNWRRGFIVHSRFIGFPWLAMKLVKNEERARLFEPVLCLLIGAPVWVISPSLGHLIMGGFISLAVCMGTEQFAVYKRLQHMHDAALQGEYDGELFRRGRG